MSGRAAVPHVVTLRNPGDGGFASLPVSQRGGQQGGVDIGHFNEPG